MLLAPVRRVAIGRDDEQELGADVDRPEPGSDITINDDAIAYRPTQSTTYIHFFIFKK